jgi:hypothetical protein
MATLEERLAAARAAIGGAPPPAAPGGSLEERLARARADQGAQGTAEPGWLSTTADVAGEVLFPHARLAGAVGQQIERGGQALMNLPQQAMDTAKGALATTGTHYRTLAHGVGLPVEPPTPEASGKYKQAVGEMLATVGGGVIGKIAGTGVSEMLKRAGRGFRTRAGAERFLSKEAGHMVSGAPTATLAGELTAPAITGAGTAAVVDWMDPTPYEFTDKPVAGGAGVAAAALAHREAMDNLLLQNPRFRGAVMRGSGGAPVATAIGAVMGYLGAKGWEWTADKVDDLVQFFAPDDATPGPQSALPPQQQLAGASDVSGALPFRTTPPRSEGLEQQRELAKRLMLG